jgi:hypothetical protein
MMMTEECPCTLHETEFFEPIPKQVVLDKGQWVDIHPLNNLSTDGPIEFDINGSADEFIDLNNTMLQIRVKIVNAAGDADLVATDVVAPINNWLHSMFSDIILNISGKVVEGGSHHYPYKAYLTNLLTHNKTSKETQLKTSGWYKDTANKMNEDATANNGLKERKALIGESKVVELCGPLLLDFMLQNKYLIPNTDWGLKLNRSKSEFQTMIKTGNTVVGRATAVKVKIESAILHVRRVTALPSFVLEIENKLNFQNAVYPIQRTEMSTYTIATGSQSHVKESLFRGKMPKFVLVAPTRNDGYNGSYAQNPFNFQNFAINHIALYREGESIPFRPFTPDFANKMYMREYTALLQSLDLYNKTDDIDLDPTDFAGGYCIFGFNLTPNMVVSGQAQSSHDGNLRLEIQFKTATTHTLNIIVMGIFDGRVEITKQRNVHVDWKS